MHIPTHKDNWKQGKDVCNYLSMSYIPGMFNKSLIAKYTSEAEIKAVHFSDVIMGGMASHITSLTIVFSIVFFFRKHESSASLSFVQGFHRWLVNSPHKGPVTRKLLPCHDIIMQG